MMKALLAGLSVLALSSCMETSSQEQPGTKELEVGGPCEGCEAVHESPLPFEKLSAVDTLPDFADAGQKIMISGIIYLPDGKTPARDVVLYFYHTNQQGIYPRRGDETGWALRHGYIRGWIKTGADGSYRFCTLRPASYLNTTNPQHIHVFVKEQGKKAYWIDDYLFSDDPFLSQEVRNQGRQRGGSGVVRLEMKDGLMTARRDIVLGMNIPDYPRGE